MCYSCVKKCKKVISYLPQILPHPVQSIFFFFSYFIQSWGFLSVAYTLRQLILPDLESRFIVRSQLGPCIQSGSSPSAGLQVVTQSTHLSKDSYPQLVSNPHRSEIRPPKQLDCRCLLLHPALFVKLRRHASDQVSTFYNSITNLGERQQIKQKVHLSYLTNCHTYWASEKSAPVCSILYNSQG